MKLNLTTTVPSAASWHNDVNVLAAVWVLGKELANNMSQISFLTSVVSTNLVHTEANSNNNDDNDSINTDTSLDALNLILAPLSRRSDFLYVWDKI